MDEEIELKLALTPESASKLARTKEIRRIRKSRAQRRLITTYFDTPRHVLRKSGIALRVRDDGYQRVQTVKAPVEKPQAGLQHYKEWTVPLEGDKPDLTRIGDAELARTLARRRCSNRLETVFTTELTRTTYRLKTRGSEIELALDEGTIRTGRNGKSREEAVCEAELELLSGDAKDLLDVALRVCENVDVRLSHSTKAERGYALTSPTLRPRSQKASKIKLDPETTVGEAFRSIVVSALEHLFANQVPILLGDPEGVHQTRVAMRRIRAALRAFKNLLPYHERKAFNGEFRWFQQRLAPARDWHVFLAETLPLVAKARPEDRLQISRLRRLARDERRRATREAVEHLKGRRYARLILEFQKWLIGLDREVPEKIFNQKLTPFAYSVLKKTRRDLLRETRPLTRLPAEDLHDLRKRGKKSRYATEFFSALWTGPGVKPFLKTMERLQDRFGEANDAAVARQILWTLPPSRLDPELVDIVQKWSRSRIEKCIQNAKAPWRQYRRDRPFWELPS